MQTAVKYFAYFGGYDRKLDLSKEPFELIKEHILPHYGYIHKAVVELSGGDNMSHTILREIALGDGRSHSAVKRSRLSKADGYRIINNLCEDDMLVGVRSIAKTKKDELEISEKLYFPSPFLRFWFAFISPYFKGIKAGEYDEVKEKFNNYKDEFINLIFEQLCEELLRESIDEKIEYIGNYWDNKVNIDLLAITKSKKTIVCSCKWSNSKVKKSSLTQLKEKANLANLNPDAYVLFSKNGFSSELKALKGDEVQLFSVKNLQNLIKREAK